MSFYGLIAESPATFLAIVTIFGLIIGSFLNVVIHRLPSILEKQWKQDCKTWLEEQAPSSTDNNHPQYNLITPRSCCPNCGHKITALENIPLISYLLLRGKCAKCKATISLQYPLVEASSAILALIVAWKFGFSWQCAAAIILSWVLITLSVIDLRTKLLPDIITLPFLWAGLLINLEGTFTDLTSSVLGAVIGYLSLWTIYHVFKLLTGKEGMGYGDFKLLALLGAWLGWQSLPLIVIFSSFLGTIVGVSLILLKKHGTGVPMPFGPYLASAGWLSMLWGNQVINVYLAYPLG